MDEYLSYVNRLRDRVANASNQDGVTKWALGLAVLYLLFQSLPTFTELIYGQEKLGSCLYLSVHVLGFLIGCMGVYACLKGKSKFSIRDYRYKKLKSEEWSREFCASIFSDGLYFVLNLVYVFMYFEYKQKLEGMFVLNGIELYFVYTAAIFGALYLLMILVMPVLIGISNYIKPEFPILLTFQIQGDNSKLGFKIFVFFVLSFLILGNITYILSPTISIPFDIYKESLIFSVQFCIALIGISVFIRNINTQDAVLVLDKLERDIVLHQISESEIKLRLQEHFGYEINEFISVKITEMRDLAAAIENAFLEYDPLIESIKKIPEEYKHEKSQRTKEYFQKLKSLISLNKKKYGKLIQFLEYLLKEAKDEDVIQLIKNYKNEIGTINEEVGKKSNEYLSKMEAGNLSNMK